MSLLQRSQFAASLAAERRRFGWWTCCGTTGFMTLMAVMSAIDDLINESSLRRSLMLDMRFIAAAAVYLIGGAAFAYWSGDRSTLKCARCKSPLALSAHVLVCGRCWKCGVRVFTDDDSSRSPVHAPTTRKLLTLAEFQSLRQRWSKISCLPALFWSGGGLALLLLSVKWWPRTVPRLAVPLPAPLILAHPPLSLICGIAVLGWVTYLLLREARPCAPCPHCGDSLSECVGRTGHCSTCGRPALSNPHPGLEPRQPAASATARLWTTPDFYFLAKRGESDQRIGYWVALALTIGTFIAAFLLIFLLIAFRVPELFPSLPPRTQYNLLFPPLVIPILAVPGTWLWWWNRRLTRDIRCPECRGELLGMYKLVISSHRCYRCGSVVLHEESADALGKSEPS